MVIAAILSLPPNFTREIAAQVKTFDELFPTISANHRTAAFADGVIRSINISSGRLELTPAANSGIDIVQRIQSRNLPFLTESLVVIPYNGNPWRVLDAYNALGNISRLRGRVYDSNSRGSVPLFEEAVRLDSSGRNNPIPDPPPATSIPSSETIFIRLKDVNFGNSYYRAEITPTSRGLLYNLTNNRNITYLFITAMREGNFSTYLYIEPIKEGMLIYSIAGTNVSSFVANRIHIPSAISKRLEVFIGWISDGLREI